MESPPLALKKLFDAFSSLCAGQKRSFALGVLAMLCAWFCAGMPSNLYTTFWEKLREETDDALNFVYEEKRKKSGLE
jgi:hypothetical protein